MNNLEENLNLAKHLYDIKQRELAKLPYHFNLVDLIGANENAHSKIIGTLLQYKDNENFPFLAAFLDAISLSDQRKTITNPLITIEKERIDLLILDKNYALIIENKVHNAVDQDDQIDRYYDIVKKKGYSEDQIFVAYLTRRGFKVVGDNSLSEELKNKLKERFLEINFKEHILPWLKNILNLCPFKEQDLIDGIKQYTQHLNQLLELTDNHKKIYYVMNNELKSALHLNDKSEIEIFSKLTKKNKEVQALNEHLNTEVKNLSQKYASKFFEAILKKIELDKIEYSFVHEIHQKANKDDFNQKKYFGIKINKPKKINGKEFFPFIEFQDYHRFICGVFIGTETEEGLIQNQLAERLNSLSDQKNLYTPGIFWTYINLDEFSFENEKLGENLFTENWTKTYIQYPKKLVDMYAEKVKSMLKHWNNLDENLKFTEEQKTEC